MSDALHQWEQAEDRAERRRWSLSAATVLLAFGAAVLAWEWRPAPSPAMPIPAAMLIELAPETQAPPEPEPPPPEPPPPEPLPRPVKLPTPPKVETPPPSEIALPEPPPEPPQPEQAVVYPAPQTLPAPRIDPRAASAKITYQGLLLAHLERNKRYPRLARSQRQEGVPYLRFVATRDGRVLSSRIERSSGHASLDEEALDLLQRAQPLPAFTADMVEETIDVVVPIEFFLRRR